MKKAIVSIIIGKTYLKFCRDHCEPSWRAYSARYGYDIVIIDRPIRLLSDTRSIHWQKLLILELPALEHYDRIVWIDSDILINHEQAPSIIEAAPANKIGV